MTSNVQSMSGFTSREDFKRQDSKNRPVIAIVANTTWNIYNFRLNILRKLTSCGYTIYVIAPVDEYIHYQEEFPNLTHIPLRKLKRKGKNPVNDLLLTLELVRLYRRIDPDLILHYTVKPNIFGGFAAGFLSIRSFAVVTGLGYAFIRKGLIQKITVLLYKLSARNHDRIIFENQEDLSFFKKLGILRNNQGLSIKGCGVNIEYFKPLTIPKKSHSEIVFTFIGRLLYDKGIRDFISAAKIILGQYDSVRFWIVGKEDPGNPSAVPGSTLQNWLIPGRIDYLGFLDDVRQVISQSDCIVLPSYREAIARSLLEAMAMEKPVISSDAPGCAETVDHGKNGLIVPVADADALALAMNRFLILTEEERTQMGKKGRIKVLEEFDDRLIANKIFTILEDT